jgi:hypothetical protein
MKLGVAKCAERSSFPGPNVCSYSHNMNGLEQFMPRQMRLVGFVWTVFAAILFGFLTTDLAEAQLLGRRHGAFDRGHLRSCEDTRRPPRFGGLFRGRFQPCPDPCGASQVVMAANGTLIASPSVAHPSPLLLQQSPPAAYLQPVPQPIRAEGQAIDSPTDCDEYFCVFTYDTTTNTWRLVSDRCPQNCYCEAPNEQNQIFGYPPTMSGEVVVLCKPIASANYFNLQMQQDNGGTISNINLAFVLQNPVKLNNTHVYRISAGNSSAGAPQFWKVTVEYDPMLPNMSIVMPIGSGLSSRVTYPGGSQAFIHSGSSKAVTYEFSGYKVIVSLE